MTFSAFFFILELIRLFLVRLRIFKSNLNPIIHITPIMNYYNKSKVGERTLSNEKKDKPPFPNRILVVGQLNYGTTSWSRLKALDKLMEYTNTFNVTPFINDLGRWGHILTNHLYSGHKIKDINRLVLAKSGAFQPDILWIDKGLRIWPDTLDNIRKGGCGLLIHFSPDNQMIPGNQSRHYLKSIPFFDVHVTTKTHNVQWLMKCGAPRVEYIGQGFDPALHRPITLTPEEFVKFGCDIGFVGHWEPSREELLLWLWRKGYHVKIWGGNWERAKYRNLPLIRNAQFLVGDDYTKAIFGAKINLCLVSVWFGDKTTSRSLEIPACGKFMIAERNQEHQELFKEGIEVEFYDSREELIDKVNYYLEHDDEREAIANAGYHRCQMGYSNEARLNTLLSNIL
jgi:spore maturation protein CgeB